MSSDRFVDLIISSRSLTFICPVSIGMIVTETFGKLEKIMNFSVTAVAYSIIISSYPAGTSQPSNLVVLIHDAFQPLGFWDGFMPPPNWQGVMIDTHIYQTFSVPVRLESFFGS